MTLTVSAWELAAFGAAMFLLVASPGPFVAALAARSAALGRRSGSAMAVGAAASETLWIAAALLGLGAIAAAHGWALAVLKYVGGAWLMWIGLRLLFARKTLVVPAGVPRRAEPLWRAAMAGALINLGNPKAALFYMTVFPGFFDMSRLTPADGLAILAVSIPVGLGNDLAWVWASSRAGRYLADRKAARRVDQISGGVLTGAGAAIAAS